MTSAPRARPASARAHPVINIDILKGDGKLVPKLRMERFDIDIGKCMYCGLCVEPCPPAHPAHARVRRRGDALQQPDLRFVPDVLQPVVAYKPPKGADAFPRRELGEITRP